MAEQALALGVPEEAIRTETRSQTTLQNALNHWALDGIDPGAPSYSDAPLPPFPRLSPRSDWAGFLRRQTSGLPPTPPVQEITPVLLLGG